MKNEKSIKLYNQAVNFMPGGVNSPVRAFKSVGLDPLFIKKAKDSKIIDEDGNEFIDYVCSWGAIILGHAYPEVIEEIKSAAENGTSYGAPIENEIKLAKLICEAIPSIEMIRMVNSGTEAVMSAIRLARGYTKRDKILKFEGCYHGHFDGMLIKAGSGALTSGIPDSAGVPIEYAADTITAKYNDCEGLRKIFQSCGDKLAAVIVEPVAANMGVVVPKKEFLLRLRKLCDDYGTVLIFDEVITGFRVSYNGAQGYFGIKPDLTVLGKIIGGGLPVGAYGGKKEIMGLVSPIGPVYQAGTLSGNPVAMAAGVKTLEILRENQNLYSELQQRTERIEDAYYKAAQKYDIPIQINRVSSLMSVFFSEDKVENLNAAQKSDLNRFADYFARMLEHGVYLAPAQFEAMFITAAHNDEDINLTINAIESTFAELA